MVTIYFVPYQNKTTEHHNEQNKPFCIFVLHKASDAASKLEPREVLFCGCRESAALRETVINLHNVSVRYPSRRFSVGQYNITSWREKKLVLNICDNTSVRFGIDERLHKFFILFPQVFNSGNLFSFPFLTLVYIETLLLL